MCPGQPTGRGYPKLIGAPASWAGDRVAWVTEMRQACTSIFWPDLSPVAGVTVACCAGLRVAAGDGEAAGVVAVVADALPVGLRVTGVARLAHPAASSVSAVAAAQCRGKTFECKWRARHVVATWKDRLMAGSRVHPASPAGGCALAAVTGRRAARSASARGAGRPSGAARARLPVPAGRAGRPLPGSPRGPRSSG
jgi:hypothetical protein